MSPFQFFSSSLPVLLDQKLKEEAERPVLLRRGLGDWRGGAFQRSRCFIESTGEIVPQVLGAFESDG